MKVEVWKIKFKILKIGILGNYLKKIENLKIGILKNSLKIKFENWDFKKLFENGSFKN